MSNPAWSYEDREKYVKEIDGLRAELDRSRARFETARLEYAALLAERDLLKRQVRDAEDAKASLLEALKQSRDTLSHAQLNIKSITGGDERRIESTLTVVNSAINASLPGQTLT